MNARPKILLVEDDETLGFLIKDSLDAHGFSVYWHQSGEKGLSAFRNESFNLCILDVMLPRTDGFALAGEIRMYDQQIPIVFLTAKGNVDDRIRGFQVGADDYVCKPFSMEEFKYRIDAVLKRATGASRGLQRKCLLTAGDSTLDSYNLVLNANGHATQLTFKECKLLEMFFRHAGKLVERDVFLKAVWEDDGFFVARSMDVFVSRLRKYLKKDPALRIENIRGIGYVLKVNEQEEKKNPGTLPGFYF